MNKIEILVIGQEKETRQLLVSRINEQESWQARSASFTEEAIEKFHQLPVGAVILMSDIPETDSAKLKRILLHQNKELIFLPAEPEKDPEVLVGALKDAIEKQTAAARCAFRILDDPLKNAGLNIRIQ